MNFTNDKQNILFDKRNNLQSKWNTGHNISIFDTNVYNLITLDTKNSMILDIDQWLAKKVNQSITQKNNEKVKTW